MFQPHHLNVLEDVFIRVLGQQPCSLVTAYISVCVNLLTVREVKQPRFSDRRRETLF